MEIPWLTLNNAIHTVEEFRFPFVNSKAMFYSGLVGIPVVVLLHDTSDSWMPRTKHFPIISWFLRKWRQGDKQAHLRIFRNVFLFALVACAMQETNPKYTPLDYVTERLTNTNARKSMTDQVLVSRRAAFAAADEVVGPDAFDEKKSTEQRDAALRRRHIQESRRN